MAEERFKIALNILARVGVDGDLIGEFGKAMSQLQGFESMQAMPPPIDAMAGMEQPMPQEGMGMEQQPQMGKYDDL